MMGDADFQLSNLSSCAAVDDDQPFLLELFASTRLRELAMLGANENQKRAFITMQYSAMTRCYPRAENTILLDNNVPIGRTIIDRRADGLWLIDITIMPEFRNRRIGALIVNQLLDEGRRDQLPVRLHVYKDSDAVRFYKRLGFKVTEDDGTYLKMESHPDTPSLSP